MILSKYQGLKPAEAGSSMMRVPKEYAIKIELDISELTQDARRSLFDELRSKALQVAYDRSSQTLSVEGSVQLFYSRGSDRQGNRAIWLTAQGAAADLLTELLKILYISRDWGTPSSGRVVREIVSRSGGEVTLPDGTVIFIGSTEDYESSMLSSDGAKVYPRLTDSQKELLGINDAINDGDNIDEDPFK